jgi:hypothetical protein
MLTMAKYLISFPAAAMVVPDGELEAVGRDAHAVIEEAKADAAPRRGSIQASNDDSSVAEVEILDRLACPILERGPRLQRSGRCRRPGPTPPGRRSS